ncbi:MAG: hypothetical protein IPM29_02885 [Planctomycetes bacterium]|nr:hypothetical protein [Planctomycetota bacterium]
MANSHPFSNRPALRPLALLLALGASASAQSVVLPAGYDVREGENRTPAPAMWPARMQFVYGDARGRPMTLRHLAWRGDGNAIPVATYAARTVSTEVNVCDGDASALVADFARNQITPPVTVFARRDVSYPDHRAAPRQSPAPFDIAVQFDQPYVHTGLRDLLLDIRTYAGSQPSSNDSYHVDVATPWSSGGPAYGAWRMVGEGCPGAIDPYEVRGLVKYTASATGTDLALACQTRGGPRNAPGTLLVGVRDPDLAVPGLCARLRVDPILSISIYANSETGIPLLAMPFDAGLAGVELKAQGFLVDASQGGLGLQASPGLTMTVAPHPVEFRAATVFNHGGRAPSITQGWAPVVELGVQ